MIIMLIMNIDACMYVYIYIYTYMYLYIYRSCATMSTIEESVPQNDVSGGW